MFFSVDVTIFVNKDVYINVADTRAVIVQTAERRPSRSISGVWSKGELVQLTDISPIPLLNFTENILLKPEPIIISLVLDVFRVARSIKC